MKNTEVVTVGSGKASLRRPKFGLFYVLVTATSLAWPAFLGAAGALRGDPLNVSSRQSGGPGSGQQTTSPQLLRKGNDGRGSSQPPAQHQPRGNPRSSSQDRPPRPGFGVTPWPPNNGGPIVGNPHPGPVRPPIHGHPHNHPGPRPPVHYPHYGPAYPSYVWGGGDGWRLHQFFRGDMQRIHRMRRRSLVVGGFLPRSYVGMIQPIPPGLMVYLPPVPPGYEVGYYDGYGLLYDPRTLRIVSAIDLYRY